MSARKVEETPEEKAAWEAYIAEQQRPLTLHLDRERTARNLPWETWRTCAFCGYQAWWQVEYISEWGDESDPEIMDVCNEHLHTAFS